MRTVASLIFALGLGLLFPATADAQQNPYYPVQGVLSDAAGATINGTLPVVFSLYLNETGGVSLWNETVSVEFVDGLFSIYLGEVSTLDPLLFADNDGLWLGITVSSDPEMARVFLASTPYSAYAEHAGNVAAGDILGVLGSSQVTLPPGIAIGPQGCPGGSFAVGLDVTGALTCATGPSAADFAFSNQACPGGEVAVGIDTTGSLLCEPPYTSVSCAAGDVVVGFDSTGAPICDSVAGAIAGGTGPIALGSDVNITGDLDVTGTLTVGGQTLGYPSGPQYLFGNRSDFCTASSNFNVGWVDYPVSFAAPPVIVAGIDESINDSGASWMRLHRSFTNRAGFRCNSNADGVDYFAIEPGEWTIDQKNVKAGIVTGPVTNGQAVFFPNAGTPFAQPPVVVIMMDETGNQSGPTSARVINTVTTGGFEVYVDSTMDNLQWVAMDPGEYNAGRWHWYAGVFNANNTCSSSCAIPLPPSMFTDSPHAVMTVNDTNNSGAVNVRHREMTPSTMTVRLNANTENIHYVAWERN